MKHDVTFVTAVYDNLSTTEFAGRYNRGAHYAFSLAQVQKMGAPIYCFTDRVNMHRYFPALYAHGLDNFSFINYNLEEHPLHSEIQRVKDTNKELYRDNYGWQARCVEIMWGKFDWLLHVINEIGESDEKYLYWIDAGLSYGGIIPRKYNSVFNPNDKSVNASKDYHNSFKYDRIFKEGFPDYLAEFTGKDKLFHMVCRNPQHSDPSHLKLREHISGTAIGGLFGGNTRMLKTWALEAIEVCKDLLANDYILKEEDVNSYLVNQHYNDGILNLYMFDTWYHEDWLEDTSKIGIAYNVETQTPFSNFFEPFVNQNNT